MESVLSQSIGIDSFRYNLEAVKKRIEKACTEAGRKTSDLTLVVVTKNRSDEALSHAYHAGCRDFGENKVQEFLEKYSHSNKSVKWHFIGSLQKNKINKVLGKTALIHSVDSLILAKEISKRTTEITKILLQVNSSGELSKHGFSIEQLEQCFEELSLLPRLDIQGMMTLAPLSEDKQKIRKCFSKVRKLRDQLATRYNIPLKELSMGMSNDFEEAILEGATLIRLGTILFSK
jgi:PLP dependent protein